MFCIFTVTQSLIAVITYNVCAHISRYKMIGELTDNPVRFDRQGKLTLTYNTTESCPAASGTFYSTVITLTCDSSAVVSSFHPISHYNSADQSNVNNVVSF